jgi:BASS family bile acid:Na+ symporter
MFRSPRSWLAPLFAGVVMNYAVLGGLNLGLSSLLISDEAFKIGLVILAAVPPAVAVIPFTTFLKGDTEFSLQATLGCYLSAFIFTPMIFFSSLGYSFGYQGELLVIMIELIIIPLILSRILLYTRIASRIEPIKGTLINWTFFIVVYTVVGLNREVFLSRPLSLIPVTVIALASTFLLGYVIERIGRLLSINPKKRVCFVLLGTLKNTGFAAGLALTLFNKQAAVPSTISTILQLSSIILLDLKKH